MVFLSNLGRTVRRLSAPALAPPSSLSLRRPLALSMGPRLTDSGGGKKAVGNGRPWVWILTAYCPMPTASSEAALGRPALAAAGRGRTRILVAEVDAAL